MTAPDSSPSFAPNAPSPAPSSPAAAPWRRNVTLFLAGQTASLFGSMVVQYAVMWYVTLGTQSGWALALYAIAAFAPQGVVSIFGGVLADRMNRKVLAIASDGIIAAVTLALAAMMAAGVNDLWIILVAVAVRSLGAGVQQPAVQAMIPQIAPADQLMRVNGMFQTIQSAMALVAPAVAGAVYAAWGIVPTFFIDVTTAVIGIGLLALVPVATLDRSGQDATTYLADLAEGVRYVWHHAVVRWLLLVFAILFLLTVAPSFITPLMVARSFGDEAWMLAALEIAFSIGMVLGGVAVSTFLAKRAPITLILVSSFGFAAFTIGLGLSPNLWVFYANMFCFGLLVPLFSTPFMTLMQRTVEPERHGRVFSYVGIVMALAPPAGMLVFGPLADIVSVQSLLVGGGVATAVVMLVAMLVPSGREAMRLAREPEPAPATDSV